ncbi:hypothetical protein R1flu_008034 [Riccia fluitans]|uniref:Uncharacterized protein n=1 Tax=Riccia fluitans TaxID=41844 RepID=A0ABD1YAJ3_9MARC
MTGMKHAHEIPSGCAHHTNVMENEDQRPKLQTWYRNGLLVVCDENDQRAPESVGDHSGRKSHDLRVSCPFSLEFGQMFFPEFGFFCALRIEKTSHTEMWQRSFGILGIMMRNVAAGCSSGSVLVPFSAAPRVASEAKQGKSNSWFRCATGSFSSGEFEDNNTRIVKGTSREFFKDCRLCYRIRQSALPGWPSSIPLRSTGALLNSNATGTSLGRTGGRRHSLEYGWSEGEVTEAGTNSSCIEYRPNLFSCQSQRRRKDAKGVVCSSQHTTNLGSLQASRFVMEPWSRNSEGHSNKIPIGGRSDGPCDVELHRGWPVYGASQIRPLLLPESLHPQALTSARPRRGTEIDDLSLRLTLRKCVPHSRDTPPKRDTGIASEKEWGINLKNEKTRESGVNEDDSTWYRENGEDLGHNGYRCRWTVMGGKNADGTSEWKEAWWEKSDWSGYKELGAEKSGRNAQGDTWWETWQEILRQDDWSNLARIEKSAKKQAKSGSGTAGWYEKWWEKYNAKGWSEKGAHKYGRLNDQGWWEKWGEQYDGRGGVLKWTDKWAETDMGTKWGDKWEEKFNAGVGTRQGETWHYSAAGERWSRTWGEEHFGNGKVHKYGKSTSGETWDSVVEESTFYQAEPHYGWADAVGNSGQLLSIVALQRPPGIYPDLDLRMNKDQL